MTTNLNKNLTDCTFVPELLVPAGDMECLHAGVQNGANAIYFGASSFSARSNAKNFSIEELKEAIQYCKLRNVKTNLTINTLLTDDEFPAAYEVAKTAYEFGIDAIIIQDLGFAKVLIKDFPGLDIHASTQMSVHNLEGVLELQKLGFKRVVLSREVPINEIEYIRNNCNIEIEMFIHGALCISYSGQCLFSSMVGGRSGNRGKCAQPCRLPYELIEENKTCKKTIDKGYLLSPRDLCALEFLPKLIKLGVNSFKIEGRMKTPEYVATVTRIYSKYINLALSNNSYIIDEKDLQDLKQVFNRGGFSNGHLSDSPNKNLIFKDKPSNMGLYLGNISNYNSNKGYISLQLNEKLSIGDCVSIDGETGKYTVSELMIKEKNVKNADIKSIVKIGRMKGNIKVGSKVYKVTNSELSRQALQSYYNNNNVKIPIDLFISIKKSAPISINLKAHSLPFYNNIDITYVSKTVPETATSSPISKERIISQFSKLGNTPYSINTICVDLDENLHIASIGDLNDIRRNVISKLEDYVINNNLKDLSNFKCPILPKLESNFTHISNRKTSLLLETLNVDYDYSSLTGIDNVYIPLKFFENKKYGNILTKLSTMFCLYVYMPTIMKPNYKNLLLHNMENIINNYNIHGFVVSNIAGIIFLENYISLDKYNIVANYTMNVFNNYTVNELKNIGINVVTPSVEANNSILESIIQNSSIPVELIAYGRTIVMNTSYCLLGKTNKCYPECDMKCSSNNVYYLKDRLGFNFRIIPDNVQTVTSIYNSKITSIDTSKYNISSVRINIVDESIDEINSIVACVKSGKRLEGNDYTNGNLNRDI